MKRSTPTLVAALALTLLAGCAQEREVPRYPIEDFLETTDFRGIAFSPGNDKVLVSSNETGIYNAFALPVAGGEPVRLTGSTADAIFVRSYFPADERFIYHSDRGGNERTHVFVRERDGTVTDLTPGEELKAGFHGWAADDRSFFLISNERDSRYFDVFEVAADGYESTLVYQDDTGYQFADISPDKRYLAFEKPVGSGDSDIYLWDRGEERMLHVTPHEGEVANKPLKFSPDGASLLFTTDDGSEFKYLVRYDLATGEREILEKPDWDVVYAHYSKNGKFLVVGINADARTVIRIYDTATMTPVELAGLPDADITSVEISADESTVAFYASSARSPRDVYVQTIGAGEPRRLTRSLNPAIVEDDLVQGEVVRFASYDGVDIPGILYRPHGASAERKAPALVWVHGGPGGQSRIGYRDLIQYLVNHGYVVYAINNRGSSGYGKTFYKMDDRRHGEADLDDCVASKAMLVDTGYVDPDRIGIIGGSYGGYMVLAALAFRPEEFAVGVDIFGVANWPRTLTSIPDWWESFRLRLYRELGDPEEDSERLHRISPLFHAGNITRPLMVLQGANDPRVLQIESDEMVQAARDNGAIVEYIIFEDEGHGFRKKDNQLEGYRGILRFLDTHLKGESPG